MSTQGLVTRGNRVGTGPAGEQVCVCCGFVLLFVLGTLNDHLKVRVLGEVRCNRFYVRKTRNSTPLGSVCRLDRRAGTSTSSTRNVSRTRDLRVGVRTYIYNLKITFPGRENDWPPCPGHTLSDHKLYTLSPMSRR